MTAYDAYKLYLALKRHFTGSYDYFKYQGRIKVTESSFEKRNDKAFFYKLAKHPDLKGFLVSTFVQKGDLWVGDIVHNPEVEQLYDKWKTVQDSLQYTIKNDLAALPASLQQCIRVTDGQHPLLLKRVLSQDTRIETMMALNHVIQFAPVWNAKIADPILWPDLRLKCRKYWPFVKFNHEQHRKLIVDCINTSTESTNICAR